MKQRTALCLLSIVSATVVSQTSSPCPRLFVYEKKSANPSRWYGIITLLSDATLNGVWLRLILDRPSLKLGNWFGQPVHVGSDNRDYLIKNPNFVLKPNTPHVIRFFIDYDPELPVPRLLSFRVNGKVVCPEDDDAENVTTEKLELLTSGPGNFSIVDRSNREANCGRIAIQPRPLITFGAETEEGEFPWHAALYYHKQVDQSYICGGSLISTSHVITVAHCITRRKSSVALHPKNVAVYLGKYNLHRFTGVGIQNRKAATITPHPGYDPANYSNDIAIIELEAPVEVTDYVGPVCLWSQETDLNFLVNKQGAVVGWGFDETGKVTEHLMRTTMPVVSRETCLMSYPEFFTRFASPYTYCAGYRNGTSVCNGDSGGGMVFPRGQVWELRGLVSISVALQNHVRCDTSHYVVFTDSAKYLGWIKEVISKVNS